MTSHHSSRTVRLVAFLGLCSFGMLGQSHEFRGVWYTPRVGSGFATQAQIAAAMDSIRDNNFNTVLFDVWSQGYPLWWSQTFSAATKGSSHTDPKAGNRDLLAEAIAEAHRRGLEIEAWFEYGFVGGYSGNRPVGSRRGELLDANPSWLGRSSGGADSVIISGTAASHYWMSHVHPEVQGFISSLATEIADGYDVDGIELDRIRYPRDDWGYDSATVASYQLQFGVPPPAATSDASWKRWRADRLNDFHHSIYDSIKAHNANLLVTNAPSHYASGASYPAYVSFNQDWAAWVNGGYLDAVHLQQYVSSASILPGYLSSWMQNLVTAPAIQQRVFPGIAVAPDGNPFASTDFLSMVQTIRSAGLGGLAIWYYEDLNRTYNGRTYWSYLSGGPFQQFVPAPLRTRDDWRIPAVLVSDYDTMRVDTSGQWTKVPSLAGYFGPTLQATPTGTSRISYSASVEASGWYDVYAFVVGYELRTARAPYDLYDSAGTVSRVLVDQSDRSRKGWLLLGTRYCASQRLDRIVTLSNDGIESDRAVGSGGLMLLLNRRLSPEAKTTSVSGTISAHVGRLHLEVPYPNPFNPETTIRFFLERCAAVSVVVYDPLGRAVRTLADGAIMDAGWHTMHVRSEGLSSGTYFVRVASGADTVTQKIVLLR